MRVLQQRPLEVTRIGVVFELVLVTRLRIAVGGGSQIAAQALGQAGAKTLFHGLVAVADIVDAMDQNDRPGQVMANRDHLSFPPSI